jgi:hypothetical protein
MNKIFVNNIGDLGEAQRASFYSFLSTGISQELQTFPNPFLAKIRVLGKKKVPCFVYIYPNENATNPRIQPLAPRDAQYIDEFIR